MRYYVLSLNGECRIFRYGTQAALSDINYAAFGIPYGVSFIGTDRNLSVAMALACGAGFTEAIVNGVRISIVPTGLSGSPV